MNSNDGFTDSNIVRRFMFAGKAYVSVIGAKSQVGFSYFVRGHRTKGKSSVIMRWSVYYVDPFGACLYLGCIHPDSLSKLDPDGSDIAKDDLRRILFQILLMFACNLIGELPNGLMVAHDAKCGKCGKPLNDELSKTFGLGPRCLRYVMLRFDDRSIEYRR